jgi:Na+-driven multidrug efflux pump
MPWWIVIYAVSFLQFPLGVALRSIEVTKPFFVSVACEVVFGLLAAYVLPQLYGIHGVMFGIFVTRALPVLVLGYAIASWRRQTDRETGCTPAAARE